MKRLKTNKYLLKLLENNDINFYIDLYQDAELMSLVGKFEDINVLQKSFLKSVSLNQEQPFQRLTYCIYSGDTRLGITSLVRSKTTSNQCEIGTIVVGSELNKGIANDVMTRLIKLAFTELNIIRVYANFSSTNHAARKLVENLEFKIEEPQNGFCYCYIEKHSLSKRGSFV